MKKYKKVYLILLLILSVVLNNYQKFLNTEKEMNSKENIFSYTINYSKYDLSNENVYVGDDNDFEILSNISIQSVQIKIEEEKLKFYQWNEVQQEFNLIRLNLGNLNVKDNDIIIPSGMTYKDFVSNITTKAIYKVINDNQEITSGNIQNGMKLKVYLNNKEVDLFDIKITNEHINLDKLNIKNNKYIIKNISTVANLKQEIDTSGNITVLDKEGNPLEDTAYLTTDSKVKIQLSDNTYEYTIVILGDITGSGDIFIGDISKLYQYYKKTINMEECYIIAGDITYDNIIEINDVAKLYQYYKKIINSL